MSKKKVVYAEIADKVAVTASKLYSASKELCSTDLPCRKYENWIVKSAGNYTYCLPTKRELLLGTEFCDTFDTYDLAIIAFSTAGDFKFRDAVRKTWASFLYKETLDPDTKQPLLQRAGAKNIALLFFTSLSPEAPRKTTMEYRAAAFESKVHKDMILTTLISGESHSTERTMALYDLIAHCNPLRNSQYLLRVEDNMLVHVDLLKEFIGSLRSLSDKHFIVGNLVKGEEVVRDRSLPRFLPPIAFPWPVFPAFVQSSVYLIPVRTVLYLIAEARCVRLLYFDEILLNGHFATQLNVTLISTTAFGPFHDQSAKAKRIVQRFHSSEAMIDFWTSRKTNTTIIDLEPPS